MNQWRLTTLNTFSGSTNMAYDEVLLNAVVDGTIDTPILRFYHWIMPTISIGRFQSIHKDIDLVQCKKDHIPVVRRPTGGRAVFHNHELTYALAIPPQHPLAQMNIESTYMQISEAFLYGLKQLQIPAVMEKSMVGNKTYPDKASCFAATTRHEIQINGQKLMGSAQVRHSGGVLQQGSLPLIASPNMSRYFLQPVESHPGLNEITGNPWDSSTLIPAILEGFNKVFRVNFEDYFPDLEMTALINSLATMKYQSNDWNYSR